MVVGLCKRPVNNVEVNCSLFIASAWRLMIGPLMFSLGSK